jgi:hypothetical protein
MSLKHPANKSSGFCLIENQPHGSGSCLNDQSKRVSLSTLQQKSILFLLEEEFDPMPEVGDRAPDFELKSHLAKDKKVKLSDFRGKSNVVMAFYPLAWTPV